MNPRCHDEEWSLPPFGLLLRSCANVTFGEDLFSLKFIEHKVYEGRVIVVEIYTVLFDAVYSSSEGVGLENAKMLEVVRCHCRRPRI